MHRGLYKCPCDTNGVISIPPFVGQDYFCESGYVYGSGIPLYILHPNDNKWKNHFSEMKGDVGGDVMSPHEKEREQEDAHPKTESHPTPSLHLCFSMCIILPTGQLNLNSCMQSAIG